MYVVGSLSIMDQLKTTLELPPDWNVNPQSGLKRGLISERDTNSKKPKLDKQHRSGEIWDQEVETIMQETEMNNVTVTPNKDGSGSTQDVVTHVQEKSEELQTTNASESQMIAVTPSMKSCNTNDDIDEILLAIKTRQPHDRSKNFDSEHNRYIYILYNQHK